MKEHPKVTVTKEECYTVYMLEVICTDQYNGAVKVHTRWMVKSLPFVVFQCTLPPVE